MKNFKVLLLFVFIFVGFFACSEDLSTDIPSIEVTIGEETHLLEIDDFDGSLLDLIENSSIEVTYESTNYGAMITAIGSLSQDQFHWIGFTKNNETADQGVDTIDFVDGDIFEFTENLSTWSLSLTLNYQDINQDSYIFVFEDTSIYVPKDQMSQFDLIQGEDYHVTLTPTSEDQSIIYASVSEISPIYDGSIDIKIGENISEIFYTNEMKSTMSLMDLIESSPIQLNYIETTYGPMLTQIGEYQQDDFHWIGFMKNNEFASLGLDQIEYSNGDVFEFTENLSTWTQELTMTYDVMEEDHYIFLINDTSVYVEVSQVNDLELISGEEYHLIGSALEEGIEGVQFSITQISPAYDGVVDIILEDETYKLTFTNEMQDQMSLLDLIETYEIDLKYTDTTYGPMVTKIGSLQADDFHWIGFTKNGEFAMEGLDQINYMDADVFTFSENLLFSTNLSAELVSKADDYYVFENQNQAFKVYHEDLPQAYLEDYLHLGFFYRLSGEIDQSHENENVLLVDEINIDYIEDFRELFEIEEGEIFILKFKVTYQVESSEFGIEIFAEDINGLSSTDISNQMKYPSTTNYIFYTIPDGYDLNLDQVYVGKFIYQVNAPSSIPQITLYEFDLYGNPLDQAIYLSE
ncbi:DUF4430 domain-containing protein [Hujiaoplasma nucleasis]|uniref:DUF4430 domain-containing protein n=1 Tax=Hujiaoplasma nucleasis TaxID=2725268 RepID=A0A7L6N565_9MOLU|nr:hypothetical protein [Hujiaoplasma nucleasis]QLY39644.1 DUF4430 domain-containing protein [Hujiaoplasma nucleasis]